MCFFYCSEMQAKNGKTITGPLCIAFVVVGVLTIVAPPTSVLQQ